MGPGDEGEVGRESGDLSSAAIVPLIAGQNMNDWHSTQLGRGALPRDLSGFEIEAFFTYSEPERRVIVPECIDLDCAGSSFGELMQRLAMTASASRSRWLT